MVGAASRATEIGRSCRTTSRAVSVDPTDETACAGSAGKSDGSCEKCSEGWRDGARRCGVRRLNLPSFTVCTLGSSGDDARD